MKNKDETKILRSHIETLKDMFNKETHRKNKSELKIEALQEAIKKLEDKLNAKTEETKEREEPTQENPKICKRKCGKESR